MTNQSLNNDDLIQLQTQSKNSFQNKNSSPLKDFLYNSNNQSNFGLDTNINISKTQISNPQKKYSNFTKISSIFSNQILKKIQKILFSMRICRKDQYLISKGLDKQIKEKIEEQVNQSTDILQLYQDIILLKKAIMILFTEEQLAALKLVGFTPNCFDFNSQKYTDQQNNHFQNQFCLLNSEERYVQYIKQFAQRCQNQENLSKIDKRIFSSLSISLND
ncbi:hypothetical protein ABPG74_012182 [Tetrahymena malaccensis]